MSELDFKSLYGEWSAYVYSLAYRLAGNKADAEDLTQEAFLRAYRFLKDFKGGSIKGWLYKIVTNVFYSEVEKEKKRPVLLEEEALAQQTDPLLPEPHEEVGRSETRAAVQKAISSLPADYRTALVLADMEELSYQEISEILDVPIGTVRSRISRGRALLKEKLLQLKLMERREVGHEP